jgi:hypothetical protein
MDPPLQWNGMQDHYFYNGTTFVTKISAASTEPDRPVTVPAGVTQMRICMTLARYNISPYWMLCKNYKPARYVAPETATLVYTMTNKDMIRTRQYCGTVKYLTSPFQDIVITLGDFEITIRHDIDVSLFKDVWRIMQGKRISNGKNLWFGVDLDGVVKIQGESDFIGGYHGREQALETVILIDGKVLDIATAFSEKQFDSISILSTSSVYHRPDSAAGAEVFGRKKRIVINRKGITISNRLMALDSLTLETVYMGMLSCYKTLDNIKQLDGFMFEDDLQQRPYTELPLPPHDTKIGYMTIPESVMKLEILQDNFNGNMHMVDYTDRIKLYNGNTALVNMNPGEMIKCDSRLSFGYDMI